MLSADGPKAMLEYRVTVEPGQRVGLSDLEHKTYAYDQLVRKGGTDLTKTHFLGVGLTIGADILSGYSLQGINSTDDFGRSPVAASVPATTGLQILGLYERKWAVLRGRYFMVPWGGRSVGRGGLVPYVLERWTSHLPRLATGTSSLSTSGFGSDVRVLMPPR